MNDSQGAPEGNVAGFDGVIIGCARGHSGGSGLVASRRDGARATGGDPGPVFCGHPAPAFRWSE